MEMERQTCRETDRHAQGGGTGMLTADKEEDKFRNRQAVMVPGEAAGRQIQIYIGAEIQIHAGIIQKPTDKMVTTDTV